MTSFIPTKKQKKARKNKTLGYSPTLTGKQKKC